MENNVENKPLTVEISERLVSLLGIQSRVVELHLPLTDEQRTTLDKKANTELLTAAEHGERGSIEFLIHHGADVNYSKQNLNAIEVAWENEHYDCMTVLLEADSDFPNNFVPSQLDEIDPTPRDLKVFVAQRNELHEWIEEGDISKVTNYVSQHRLSRYLNTKGVPAVVTAAKCGSVDTLSAVLKISLLDSTERIILTENTKRLLKLRDGNGNTPLLLAAQAGKEEIVDFLIRCDIEINLTNNAHEKAVDLAWEEGHYGVVLLLLKNDSDFPKRFTTDVLSEDNYITKKLKTFVSSRNDLHNFIENGNLEAVRNFINKNELASKYYFNSKGVSALLTAIKYSQYEIYSFLVSSGGYFKDEYEANCLKTLNEEQQTELNNYMIRYFSGAQNSHILYLVSKSKSMRPRENFENEVRGFYNELTRIPEISVILQVIQYAENIEIAFDFDREDVSHMDPRHAVTTKGTTEFKSGRLYIGFKRENDIQESERLGTLAHELTHIAMQILYKNNCNPYGKYDTSAQKKYEEIVNDIKKYADHSPGVEDIIKRVFIDYVNPEHWNAELIVRVPHVLARYGTDEGLDIISKYAGKLYSFYKDHVMHTCTKFVRESFLVKPRNMIRLLNEHLGTVNEYERTQIQFIQSYDTQTFIHSENGNILLLGTSSTFLSGISIYQSLQKLMQYSFDSSFLMLTPSPSEDIQNDVIHTFSSQVCNLMVVECRHGVEPQLSRVLTELYHIFRSSRKKKVLFIIGTNQLPDLRQTCETSKLTSRIIEDHDREFTLKDLNSESQKIVLNRNVNFQGYTIAIKNLYNKLETLVDSETLTKLIKNEEIKIGNMLPELGEVKNYYVQRTLNKHEQISEKILSDEGINDIFFVSGSEDSLMSNNVRIHKFVKNSSESEDEQFTKLCTNNLNLDVHWLKWEDGRLFWVMTKGSISALVKHRLAYRTKKYSVSDMIFENRQKVVIISDTAGMGKSTIMTDLAQKMKLNSPKMWIEHINLNDFNNELSELKYNKNFQFDVKSAILFLVHKILKFKTVFEQELFKKLIELEGAVTLLFDGFDEISPVYTNEVIELLKALKKSFINKLFVTTRPGMRILLERQLCVFSHSLVPFTEGNKNNFLVQFWRHRFSLTDGSDSQRLEDYAEAVINKLSVSLNAREKALTGVPLQLRMVAEVFPENKNFAGIKLPEKFDLLRLYELFFDKKYNIYKREKVKPVTAIAEDAVEQSRLISIQIHQKLALYTLFPEEFNSLVSDEESEDIASYVLKITTGQERTGIIQQAQIIRDSTRLLFIHRSFSEYFVADFIAGRLRRKKQNFEILKFLLKDILRTPLYEMIRIFLNAYLRRHSLEKVVLDKCGEIINELWLSSPEKFCNDREESILQVAIKEGNEEITHFILAGLKNSDTVKKFINNEDDQGYSAIHEATKSGNVKVVQWLIEKGANVNAVDNNGKTVLFYALQYNHSGLVKFLVEKGADIKSVDIFSLYRTDMQDKLQVMTWMVENGADIKTEDRDGDSLLHYAAEQGDIKLIQWLIEHGKADVDDEDGDGTKLIHRSASSDQWELVKWLAIHGNANVNVKDRVGNTLLHYAAFKSRLDIVQWLVKSRDDGGGGADINIAGEFGASVLHDAATSGNLALVQWLVKPTTQGGGGLSVNVRDDGGSTPLHEAALFGHLGLVQWLVEARKDGGGGADVDAVDKDGETALYSAASFGQLELVQLLLNKMDNVYTQGKDGRTILHVAATYGEVNLLKKLLADDASSFGRRDTLGRSALHYAAEHNNHDVVQLLLQNYGGSIDDRDKDGRRPIHYAASTGKHDIETWLTDRYVDVDRVEGIEAHSARKEIRFTLSPHQQHFIHFLKHKKFEIREGNGKFHLTIDALTTLKLLVDNGCRIDVADDDGRTALYEAVFHTDPDVVRWDVVEWLMEPTASGGGGADVTAVDVNGRTMLHEMAKYGEMYLLADLLKLLPGVEDATRIINTGDSNGRTPLHEAAANFSSHQSRTITLLIDKGADINAADNEGRTALHEASKHGYLDCIRIMLDSGLVEERRANVNAKDENGRTALHEACAAGHLQVAKFLVLNNAEIDTTDIDGRTSLHYAAMFNQLKVVLWLMDKKVSNKLDRFQKTAFTLAQENKYEDLVKEMIKEKYGSDLRNPFDDLLRINEHARNIELRTFSGTSSNHGCSSEKRKRRNLERCLIEDNFVFPYEPLTDTVPWHLSRRSNLYTQISMALLFELSGHEFNYGGKGVANILSYNRNIGDLLSEEAISRSSREKIILKEYYAGTNKFFKEFPKQMLLYKSTQEVNLITEDHHHSWLFDNGKYTILLLKSKNRYLLYSQYLNYRTMFQTKADLSFDHISEFCKLFFKWSSGSREYTVYLLASNIPSGLVQHINMAKLQSPSKVAPDSVLLATEHSSLIEHLPVRAVRNMFLLNGKIIDVSQLQPNFFEVHKNVITIRADQFHKKLMPFQASELQALTSVIQKYSIPVDSSFVNKLDGEQMILLNMYLNKLTKMFKTSPIISAKDVSKISWDTFGECLGRQPSISSELAEKVLSDLKDIHTSSSEGASLKGMATQTLFFLPDIIRSVNYRDTTTMTQTGAMLVGDAAVNHLYGSVVSKLAPVMPAGRAELLSRLPVTSPIFKALTIYSIVELHKQLQTSSVGSEERGDIKHKLTEQYVTLGLMAAELFGYELTPLWIGLIAEQLIFDAEALRKHYNLHISLWEAFVMSLGFEQEKLQKIIEERQFVIMNLEMINRVSNLHEVLYGWTIVKIPKLGKLDWQNIKESEIPNDVREKIVNQKSDFSYMPITEEISAADGFRLIKTYKQRRQLLNGNLAITRGKLIGTLWQRATYIAHTTNTNITFSLDYNLQNTNTDEDYFLDVYSGKVSNWHRVPRNIKGTHTASRIMEINEEIKQGHNIPNPVQSTDSVAVYVNNHTFVNSCAQRNFYIAFDPREGDTAIHFTLPGLEQIDKFNQYNNIHSNSSQTVDCNTCTSPYLLTIQVAQKFYPDSLEFSNKTGEFVLRDDSQKIFSQYVITDKLEYSIKDFTRSTSIDFASTELTNQTTTQICNDISGGPLYFSVNTHRCLNDNMDGASYIKSLHHLSSSSILLSNHKMYLRINQGEYTIGHKLVLSATHVDIEAARGQADNHSTIDLSTEVVSFNISLRGNIIILNHPVTLHIVGEIPLQKPTIYYAKSAHNKVVSFYEIKVDKLKAILLSMSTRDAKKITNYVLNLNFSCCGVRFHWINESPTNGIISIIGQFNNMGASVQISQTYDKLTLLHEDNSTAAIVTIHQNQTVLIEDGLTLYEVISTELLETEGEYYKTVHISDMIYDVLKLIAKFDYIHNILVFKTFYGYYVIHCLSDSAQIHSKGVYYSMYDGKMCATGGIENTINGRDLIEYGLVNELLQPVKNCDVCFHKNLNESDIRVHNNTIIINNIVLKNLNKGTKLYFGPEEVFPMEAIKDTLLSNGKFTVGEQKVVPDGTMGKASLGAGQSGHPPARSRRHRRARRAAFRSTTVTNNAAHSTWSPVNGLFTKLKNAAFEIWHNFPGTTSSTLQQSFPGGDSTISCDTSATEEPKNSVCLTHFHLHSTLSLLDLVLRKATGSKPPATEEQPTHLLQVQGKVLSIIAKLEDLLAELSQQPLHKYEFVFDPLALQKRLISKLINGLNSDVEEIIYTSLCELCTNEDQHKALSKLFPKYFNGYVVQL